MMTWRIPSILVLFFITLGTFAQVPQNTSTHILKFKDYWDGGKDATPAMLEIIEQAINNKISVIEIEAGDYHFYPKKAFEKYCYVPNHDNGLKRIAIPLIQAKNISFKGKDTRFIFHGLTMPFLIEESENISIEGVTIDWELPLHTEVVVIANNKETKTFDIKIENSQPYLIRNGELVFVKEGFEHNLETAILFDKDKRRVLYNTKAYTPLPYKEKTQVRNNKAIAPFYQPFLAYPAMMKTTLQRKITANEIRPGVVRISGTTKQMPPVGSVLVCKGSGGTSRLIPAMYLNKSSKISINNVSIYHAGGMGIIAEGCTDVNMDKLMIGIEEGSSRMVSTTADATHFLNCRGKVNFNNCSFSNQLDDATNVHGAYVVVEDILGDYEAGLRVGHFQQQGLYFGDKDDRVAFVNQEKSVHPFAENVIKKVEKINAGYYKVQFEEKISTELKPGMVVENVDAYPEVSIINSRFYNNRARGILLSTPKRVVVENNYFSNMMSAVFMPVELSYWYESGHSQDVLIRNNTFEDSSYGGRDFAVINIHTSLDHHDYVFGKIQIEGNTFKQFDASIVKANGIENLVFNDNTITSTDTYPPLYPNNAALHIDHIKDLTIEKNSFDGIAVKKIEKTNVENESIGKNKGISKVRK